MESGSDLLERTVISTYGSFIAESLADWTKVSTQIFLNIYIIPDMMLYFCVASNQFGVAACIYPCMEMTNQLKLIHRPQPPPTHTLGGGGVGRSNHPAQTWHLTPLHMGVGGTGQPASSPPDGQCSQRSVSAIPVYNLPPVKYTISLLVTLGSK